VLTIQAYYFLLLLLLASALFFFAIIAANFGAASVAPASPP
jgi:hypothetical protein